ncbi:MAG: hypothetical protein ABEI86_11365 [Halobacteriaceae archaeon]
MVEAEKRISEIRENRGFEPLDPDETEELIQFLTSSDEDVSAAAAEAIRDITRGHLPAEFEDEPGYVNSIVDEIEPEDGLTRKERHLLGSLVDIADRYPDVTTGASDLLFEYHSDTTLSAGDRRDMARCLGYLSVADDAMVDQLIDRARDDSNAARDMTVLALASLADKDPDAAEPAWSLFADLAQDEQETDQVRKRALDGLRYYAEEYPGEIESIATDLVDLVLDDIQPDIVRAAAAEALVSYADISPEFLIDDIEAFAAVLDTEDYDLRQQTLRIIERVAAERPDAVVPVTPAVEARISDDDQPIPEIALDTLASIIEHEPDAISLDQSEVVPLLDSLTPKRRREAATILGYIGDKEVIEDLEEVAENDDSVDAEAARDAIDRIHNRENK